MPGWDELLERLAETPRENGTAKLHETAAWLERVVREGGLDVETVAFQAHPYALRLAGVVVLLGVLLYARLAFAGRWRAALATAVVASGAVLAQLDYQVPLFSWIGAESQVHVLGRVGPEQPEQRLIFAAHYDTKTDVLDHLQRAPVDLLAVPVVPLMILGALAGALAPRFARAGRWLMRFGRFAAVAGAAYGLATFVVLSAGAFVPARSPGALDDGASCAVMVRMAEALAGTPPARTQVELLWLSAEEVGVQGSWAYAAQRFAQPPEIPTYVVNLEGLGAGAQHEVIRRETFTLRSYPPAPELVARLGDVHRRELGTPLELTGYGGATDARAFLAHGVPAATLVSHEPGTEVTRHLHSSADSRDRLDREALESSVRFLTAFVRDVDRTPLR